MSRKCLGFVERCFFHCQSVKACSEAQALSVCVSWQGLGDDSTKPELATALGIQSHTICFVLEMKVWAETAADFAWPVEGWDEDSEVMHCYWRLKHCLTSSLA